LHAANDIIRNFKILPFLYLHIYISLIIMKPQMPVVSLSETSLPFPPAKIKRRKNYSRRDVSFFFALRVARRIWKIWNTMRDIP